MSTHGISLGMRFSISIGMPQTVGFLFWSLLPGSVYAQLHHFCQLSFPKWLC